MNIMKKHLLLAVALVSLFNLSAQAQKNLHTRSYSTSKDTLLTETVDYLNDNLYFVEHIDYETGFVRAKKFKKDKSLLSSQVGTRTTLSFWITPTPEGNSVLRLFAYIEEPAKEPYFYNEEVCKDEHLYEKAFAGIANYVKEAKENGQKHGENSRGNIEPSPAESD